ncbi:MAG: PIG-L family deacetylase [Actinobacteria bacterium]|nr:PIG-L family deacetylase [Actinomycetota bacterium]MCL6094352.1 PIG-L family deacetylase [Actinomycetota bacterium]
MNGKLPTATSVLSVSAHPDDECFGLGAILYEFVQSGAMTSVLCFTHGEASTLKKGEGDLARIRAKELQEATSVLQVSKTRLLAYPDGGLASVPISELANHIIELSREVKASLLLTFDEGGVTGHPDHSIVTQATLTAAKELDLPVLSWTIPTAIANQLNNELGTTFVGRNPDDIDVVIKVHRPTQRVAIAHHRSQAIGNKVLERRLELQGDMEWLRWLYHPTK